MKLRIKNFGIIDEALIDIGDITILAGKNSTGKSTISKTIYSCLKSFTNEGRGHIAENFGETFLPKLKRVIIEFSNRNNELDTKLENYFNKINEFLLLKDMYKVENLVRSLFETLKEEEGGDSKSDILYELYDVLIAFPSASLDTFRKYYNSSLKELHRGKETRVLFTEYCNDKIYDYISIEGDETILSSTVEEVSENIIVKEAIYIDSPFILDSSMDVKNNLIKRDILSLLRKSNDETIGQNENFNKLELVLKEIHHIVKGKLTYDLFDRKFAFYSENLNKEVTMTNLATGIKSFSILAKLLLNGSLASGSYLIIDEPEVHLHPEWQVKLAKILVLINKVLNVKLVITSHSSNFIEAIHTFSTFENVKDVKIYLGTFNEKGLVYEDVSKNLSLVFKELAKGYIELDDYKSRKMKEKNYE